MKKHPFKEYVLTCELCGKVIKSDSVDLKSHVDIYIHTRYEDKQYLQSENHSYCFECGQLLKDVIANTKDPNSWPRECRRITASGDEPHKHELGYCSYCDMELAPYATFCHRCGARIENPGLPGVTNG